jgi:hypothetical protein
VLLLFSSDIEDFAEKENGIADRSNIKTDSLKGRSCTRSDSERKMSSITCYVGVDTMNERYKRELKRPEVR